MFKVDKEELTAANIGILYIPTISNSCDGEIAAPAFETKLTLLLTKMDELKNKQKHNVTKNKHTGSKISIAASFFLVYAHFLT